MGSASGGGGPAQRSNAANGRAEAGLPLSRGGRGERTVVVRSVGRAAAGRPRGCRGTRGAAERLQGWGGPDVLRGPGTAGSRPGPARGGRATPRELPGGEFAPQPKEGGSRRGPEKPPGHPGPEPPGSCPSPERPPGRPRRRVTALGSRPEEPPGDPRRGPASSGANPGAWSRGGRGLAEARGRGAEGAGTRRSGAGPPGRAAGQRLLGRQTPRPSGAGASVTAPRAARPRSGLQGRPPPGGRPGTGR